MRKKNLTVKRLNTFINNGLDNCLMNQIKGGDGQTTTTTSGSSYEQGMSLLEAQSTKAK